MKRKILVLTLSAMLLLTMLVAISASPALAQPSDVRCDWYEAGFDRNFNTDWWAYWCHYPDSGWYLIAWWSDATGIIWV